MRDSNPHGQNPAVFKTAALPIRTNPPHGFFLKIGRADFVKRILGWHYSILVIQHYFQLPLITSGFHAVPSFILNDHAYAGIEEVDKAPISPEGDTIHR